MHVEGSEPRQLENLRADYVPVIHGQDQVRLQGDDSLDPLGRVHLFRRVDRDPFLAGDHRGRLEPDFFVRVVLVGDQRDDVVAALHQELQAFAAHLAIAEKQDSWSVHWSLRRQVSPPLISSTSVNPRRSGRENERMPVFSRGYALVSRTARTW